MCSWHDMRLELGLPVVLRMYGPVGSCAVPLMVIWYVRFAPKPKLGLPCESNVIEGRKITRRVSTGSTERVPSGVAPLSVSMMLKVSAETEPGSTLCENVTTKDWLGAIVRPVHCTSTPPWPLGQP